MKRRPIMVFAGDFSAGASAAGLADGFRRLGWVVQEVDVRHYSMETGGRIGLRVASKMTRALTENAYLERLLEESRTLEPDIFLTIKGTGLALSTLKKIREGGARVVMYYPDFHFDHAGVSSDSFGEYDLFITTKSFQIAWLDSHLGADKVAYVPHGYVEKTHSPVYESVGESEYLADVLYAGNHSPYKQKWLEDLVRLDMGLDVKVIGNRWINNVKGSVLESISLLGPRRDAAYAEAVQRAKINVAIHFGPTDSGWEDQVSTRTFEIPACKGFMLHIDNTEVRDFFEPGVEIDVFSSPEELQEKIVFYLNRPELRARMIERAYVRSIKEHGYSQRSAEIQANFFRHGLVDQSSTVQRVVL